MKAKQLVKLSNLVGIISIMLLLYWVFTFTVLQVFGLKVFRENITETFYMSIMGILALMFGALIINIMFNLTRIAEKHNQDAVPTSAGSNRWLWVLALSFPLIFALLFFGDYRTTQKKKQTMIAAATSVIEDHSIKAMHFTDYQFKHAWINETGTMLQVLSKTDKHFPTVNIITKDVIDESEVFLVFHSYQSNYPDSIRLKKENFIRSTTEEERTYLRSVFQGSNMDSRYSVHDGHYELFYPYQVGDKHTVFYFSDRQRYGKVGSY